MLSKHSKQNIQKNVHDLITTGLSGRPIDKESKRQRAIHLLNAQATLKREFAIPILMEKLDIGKSYAETLHATWRTHNKKNGGLTAVYTVKDLKDGKAVSPYIKKEFVKKAENYHATDIKTAKIFYFARQQLNADVVNSL